ncbi:hypothetical protein Y032_0256g365 [Ancylostoma ceylanicum]|uniref:Uncharacterized protein n=1 Tax=Ancylostoma ceylanicum TaxID=53326 RepID=A0A016SC23_9BILA|nr:hypothetical protein Y032_0256g365 [Ancylostoma ceylanicum]
MVRPGDRYSTGCLLERCQQSTRHGMRCARRPPRNIHTVPLQTLISQAFKAWGEQSKKVDLQEIAGGVFYDGDVVTEASDWAKVTESVASGS